MCGIDGILSKNAISPELVKEMNACMAHRGPDDEGVYTDDNVALAMRRLKVIDLHSGGQPIFSEDGNVVAIFNGEIYNFRELAGDLERLGHSFRTRTDTEVLVHGYEEWGARELLSRLVGMFAFCIYDRTRRRVFLARDRLGEKPLYYFFNGDDFVFASELRAVLKSGKVPLEISRIALYSYLAVHHVPGDMCMINGVRKVLPGHYLEIGLDDFSIQSNEYWDLREGDYSIRDYDECLRYVHDLVSSSIVSRTVSDVPLGVFLSGGIDSSIIVSVLSRRVAGLKTFSIGFESEGYDETGFSDIVSKEFGTDHRRFVLDPDMVAELLPKVVSSMDEPCGDQALLPVFWLSHEARKSVTVVLGGEGGDEVFAGYSYYFDEPGDEDANGHAEPLGGFLSSGTPVTSSNFPVIADLEHRAGLMSDFDPGRLKDEASKYEWLDKLRNRIGSVSDTLRRRQYADMKTWLPDDLLMKFDKMSMAASLEGRAPFLDHRLVEFGFNLPAHYKTRENTSKLILREAFKKELPREIFEREKQGFNLPMGEWLRTKLRDMLEEITGVEQNDGLDNGFLKGLVREHLDGKAERARLLYAVLVYKLWFRNLEDSLQAGFEKG